MKNRVMLTAFVLVIGAGGLVASRRQAKLVLDPGEKGVLRDAPADWGQDVAVPGHPKSKAAPSPDEIKAAVDDTGLPGAIAAAEADKPERSQVWSEDEGNKGFSAEARAKIRIMSNVQNGMKHFRVLFDPSVGVAGNSFEFMALSQNIRLLAVRGAGKYVAMDYSTNSQYYDLKNFAAYLNQAYGSKSTYTQAGSFSTQNNQMQNVTDVEIAADILARRMNASKEDIQTIRERVKKHAKGESYVLNGDEKTVYLGYGDIGMVIWHKEIGAGGQNK